MSISKPLQQKTFRQSRRKTGVSVDIADLAHRLTARDRWVIRMLYEHRVLTSDQLIALGFPSLTVGRRRLRLLHRYSLINRFRPLRAAGSYPAHYVLALAGAHVLAAENGTTLKQLHWRQDRAADVAVSMQLAHMVGVGDWFTALATHPNVELTTWWSQARCGRLWGDLIRPDGYGQVTTDGQQIDFFLEFDLATENPTQVGRKLDGYAELARSTAVSTPILLWVPTLRRENALRTYLFGVVQSLPDPDSVPIATAPAELLKSDSSPADRHWLRLGTSGNAGRQHLSDLPAHWSGLISRPEVAENPAEPTFTAGPIPAPTPRPATTEAGDR